MTQATSDATFPSLFTHTTRKDWGVGVLAWEKDGKRGYLFENGGDRTMAGGFDDRMRKVEAPDHDQQAVYARLRGVLAARDPEGKLSTKPSGPSFLDQLSKFHDQYPEGLLDPKWAKEVRGEGASEPSPRHRSVMILDAQERLNVKALDALLAAQRFGQVWEHVIEVLRPTDLVPAAQFKELKAPEGEQQRALAATVRELLYGKHPYEQRFDRFLVAFSAAFGKAPRWEMATALSALVHPSQHVCVEPTTFRKQLKTTNTRAPGATQPGSSGYGRFLSVARMMANKLAEQGEVPRDLLDVHDFIHITLSAVPKTRVSRAAARAAAELEVERGREAERDPDRDPDAEPELEDDGEAES